MHAVYDKSLTRKRCKELWLELLAQYRRSGLTKKEFAINNGINIEDLKRWDYRFSDKSKKSKFSAIKIIKPTVQITSPIKLMVSNRYCIELAADFDAATLSRILTVLEPKIC